MTNGIYAEWAQKYRELGFWPRPIQPDTKACKVKGWQTPDPDLDDATLASWIEQHGAQGIGLLLGSPTPDKTILGALDIDDDDYVRVGEALLKGPPSGCIGARGVKYFVRIRGDASFRKLKVEPREGEPERVVGELLGRKHLAVIPPTIHPVTNGPYHWIGTPLHEIKINDLPILEVK